MSSVESDDKRDNGVSEPAVTTASKDDLKLIASFGLSLTELERYKNLDILTQTRITERLKERKDLNQFVKLHLGEKINTNKQFGMLIQLLFPSEHSLRYALQKVDTIENDINAILQRKKPLFDKNTTKRNRLEILLAVALEHQKVLLAEISRSKNTNLEDKLDKLNIIIDEFQNQLKTSNFTIHNEALRTIRDPDLKYFLSKLPMIGINGMAKPDKGKYQASFFKVSIIHKIYERLYPEVKDDGNKPKS